VRVSCSRRSPGVRPASARAAVRPCGPRRRGSAGFAALCVGAILLLGACALPTVAPPEPVQSCSRTRLDAAQQLFLAGRANLVRYYKERALFTLNAAYGFAGDTILMARSTRTCFDFDNRAKVAAVNLVRMGRQLRALAYTTMRDPDTQMAMTLLQEQYAEVFAGRDIE